MKKFKLFDSQREGKGLSEKDIIKEPNLKKFGIIYKDNLMSRLLSINIIMIIGNLPLLFAILAFIGVGQAKYNVPEGNLISILTGISNATGTYTPSSLTMIGIKGVQIESMEPTFWTYLLYGLSLLTFFTWGFVCTGVAKLLRDLSLQKPIFMMSDFFETIQNNRKQAFGFGFIDLIINVLIPFNLYTLVSQTTTYIANFTFWMNILIYILWSVARWYIYLQIVSFDMKLFKMIKNAFRFLILGWKRNLLAILGNVLLIGLTLFFVIIFSGRLVAIALILPAIMVFSSSAFMYIYAAWFKIDEIMVIKKEDIHSEDSAEI